MMKCRGGNADAYHVEAGPSAHGAGAGGLSFLGIAYGISMKENGFGVAWALLISLAIYGGSMQFALIAQLSQPFSPVTIAMMTLLMMPVTSSTA